MSESNSQDPLNFIKNMWGNMGFPLPGMVTPTLDTNELEKRITELKTVEGWLKTNLGMLQMTIHGLEMQRTTLAAMQAMSEATGNDNPAGNPFMNPALWPWPFSGQPQPASPVEETGSEKKASEKKSPTAKSAG